MEEPLEMAWVGPKFGGAGLGLRESLGHGKNSMSLVDGDSDMAPTSRLTCRRLDKGTVTSASTSVWEEASLSSCLDARHFSSSLYVSDACQTAALELGLRGSRSK